MENCFQNPPWTLYLVMHFGLTNVPAVFQAWLMTSGGILIVTLYLFIWMTSLFTPRNKKNTKQIRTVLQRQYKNQLLVMNEKCEFHVPSVSFLGFIFEGGHYRTDPAKN